MAVLVMSHIWFNFRAVKSLQLKKINEERFLLILKSFLNEGVVPSVQRVNLEETPIIGFGVSSQQICGFTIALGMNLSSKHHRVKVDRSVKESKSFILFIGKFNQDRTSRRAWDVLMDDRVPTTFQF